MTREFKIGELQCTAAYSDTPVYCYLLSPVVIASDLVEDWATSYNCNMAVAYGMDWDNDLTPWPAPGVPASSQPFKGLAPEFLATLEHQLIPEIESGEQEPRKRVLIGISLSGLFALWAWMQDDTFHSIGSISGSFWYDGFIEWLEHSIKPKPGKAWFSLGNLEGRDGGNPKFRNIQTQTRLVVELLKAHGINDGFTQTQGNHFANPMPRIEGMLSKLC